ncbi:hypothetical protein [Hymenobacter canadensis]|uniref:Uncharacterized protein n=1 Tax=Hymenobacter canadensis TaxID=2999067 RepID=A0ABY7LV58_9BACT|nr:hypothetical protein [Hymenobacter canadensis]WBA42600.1 hypothetical protein O3303_03345 [Hymenobacter canadensis]
MLGELLSDILGESLMNAINDGFLGAIGFLYLYGRYWKPQVVKQVLAQQYAGRYATAGSAVANSLMQILGVLLLVAFWIGILIVVLRHGWS